MTIYSLDVLLSLFELVYCSMFSSNCCFLTCIQISHEAGQVVWYFYPYLNRYPFNSKASIFPTIPTTVPTALVYGHKVIQVIQHINSRTNANMISACSVESLCDSMESPARLFCPCDFLSKNTGVGSSRWSSRPRDWTLISCIFYIAGRPFTTATGEANR